MQEIGSEFWDVPIKEVNDNGLLPQNTQWYISGRSALRAIIYELRDCHTVAMPSWCCDSMIKPFIDAGKSVHFYPVFWNENGVIQQLSTSADAMLIMDYFGYSKHEYELTSYKGVIIRDVTHSLFSTTYDDADYYFGSLRKWCGVWTGGFAWTKNGNRLLYDKTINCEYVEYRRQAMALKEKYIDGEGDKKFLKIYEKAEDCLDSIGIAPATNRDIQLARMINVEFIKYRRRQNAKILRESLSDWLLFRDMTPTDCPMFVPVLVPNGKRDELRSFLINNDIYCPIHWAESAYHKLDEKTKDIYQNELSLVCDQRYTSKDMWRMVDIINQFIVR